MTKMQTKHAEANVQNAHSSQLPATLIDQVGRYRFPSLSLQLHENLKAEKTLPYCLCVWGEGGTRNYLRRLQPHFFILLGSVMSS